VEVLARVHPFRFDVHVGYMRDAGDYHRRGGHLAEDTDDRTWEMEGIAMNDYEVGTVAVILAVIVLCVVLWLMGVPL
jgi:hypothetical protein